MSDEEFREFHLDGKHLAFLVISGIGVAVVVFLCGVLVGRGVRAPRAVAAADFAVAAIDDGPTGSDPLDGTPTGNDVAASTPGRERSSAPFAEPDPEPAAPAPAEPLAPRVAPPASTSAEKSAAPTPVAKPAAPPPATVPRGTTGSQWVVQVVSGTSRASAESLAAKLKSKGYEAFISEYPQGASQYRVRIGTFAKKAEAQVVADRLAKDGKYKKPWVTTR
jgi:cell division septation protein DedD